MRVLIESIVTKKLVIGIKILVLILTFFVGWWLGNGDKLILIQENEKIINDFKKKRPMIEGKKNSSNFEIIRLQTNCAQFVTTPTHPFRKITPLPGQLSKQLIKFLDIL